MTLTVQRHLFQILLSDPHKGKGHRPLINWFGTGPQTVPQCVTPLNLSSECHVLFLLYVNVSGWLNSLDLYLKPVVGLGSGAGSKNQSF